MKNIFLFVAVISLTLVSCQENKELIKVECVEVEGDPCICTQDYTPVCGCNDKTYPNKCNAECVGIMEYTEGECPDKKI